MALLNPYFMRCLLSMVVIVALCWSHCARASLVAQWHFDEDTWDGTAGEVKDSSAQGYDISLVNNGGLPNTAGASPAIAGDPGTCRYGTFAGANDGYATISDPGVNSDLDLMDNFTVAMWINLDVIPNDHVFAMEKGSEFAIELTPYGTVEIWMNVNGSYVYIDTPRDTLSAGTWAHLALTFTSGQQYLYINGAVSRSTTHVGTLPDTSDPINIGSISWASEYLQGAIDEVHIYQSVLSSAEISILANSTHACSGAEPEPEPTPTTPVLVADWHFDEAAWDGTPSEIKDSSTLGYDMSLVSNGGYPNTASVSPAISGDPGTCGYGTFAGASDGYATISDPGVGSDLDLTDNFTVAMWINLAAIPSANAYAIEKGLDFALELTPSGAVEAWLQIDGNYYSLSTGDVLSVGNWVHVAFTHTDGQQYLYVNGAEVGSSTHVGVLADTSEPINIGSISWASEYFEGAIDEVRIYQGVLSSAQASTLANSTHACSTTPAIAPVLMGEWRLDETTAYSGVADEVQDSSGNGFHGTANAIDPPATAFTTPIIDGSPGLCRYGEFIEATTTAIEIPDNDVFDLDSSGEMTLMAWVYPTSASLVADAFIIEKQSNYGLSLETDLKVKLWVYGDANQKTFSLSTLSVNTWSHVAVTFKDGEQKIYINGVLDNTTAKSLAGATANTQGLKIGDGARDLGANVDEVRLYQGLLSASDIANVMNDTRMCAEGTEPVALVAQWRFDEFSWTGVPQEVIDSSGNNYHATVIQDTSLGPTTSKLDPAIAGSAGTCHYGVFDDNDGSHTELDDPGGSVFRMTADDSYSITAWIRVDEEPTTRGQILRKGKNYRFYIDENKQLTLQWTMSGVQYFLQALSDTLSLETWYHVAATVTPDQQKLYIDGTLVATANNTIVDTTVNSASIILGDSATGDTSGFEGAIDEVRFYHGALTVDEVSAIKNETHTCPLEPAELLAEWRFDEVLWDGTAGEVLDSAGIYPGTATQNNAYPTTQTSSPALGAATSGTCRYGQFDGEQDGAITIADPGVNSVFDQESLSVSLWVNPSEFPESGVYTLWAKDNAFDILLRASQNLRFSWYDGASWNFLDSTTLLAANTWTHVVITFTYGEQQVYVNGALEGTATVAANMDVNNKAITLASDETNVARSFKGLLDEVRYYSGVLSASDVSAVYSATRACPDGSMTSLIGEWRFDEPSWNGTTNEVLDSSGNDLHGTAETGVTPTTSTINPAIEGAAGTCHYGSFLAENNTKIDVPDPGDNSLLDMDENDAFSLTAWVNIDPSASQAGFIVRKHDNYRLFTSVDNKVGFKWKDSGTNFELISTAALTRGTWHHIAVTITPTLRTIYIDGVASGTDNSVAVDLLETNFPLYIGGITDGGSDTYGFYGSIDEVRLYQGALSAAEVNSIMGQVRTCPQTSDNLVAEWRFEQWEYEGAAQELKDSSDNALHADAILAGTTEYPQTSEVLPALAGSPGSCRYYDGGTDNGAFVLTDPGDDSILDMSTYTISAWVKLKPSSTGASSILTKARNYSLRVTVDGALQNWVWDTNTSTWIGHESSAGLLTVDVWHHVAATYIGGEQNYYVDGVLAESLSIASSPDFTNDIVYIGTNFDNGLLANLAIDELRIYNRVLTAAEVNEVMAETQTCAAVADYLVGEWRFDEDAQWNATVNEVVDSGSNGLHGVAIDDSGVPERAFASPAIGSVNEGSCAYADFSASDGYISIADPGAGSPLDLPDEYTVTLWARPHAYPVQSDVNLYAKSENGRILLDTGTGRVIYTWRSDTDWHPIKTSDAAVLNAWQHISITYKQGTQKLYIDGVEHVSGSRTEAPNVNDFPVLVGRNSVSPETYNGDIDELRIYNKALTAEHIQNIMSDTRTCSVVYLPATIVINAASTASTCTPQAVTISIQNSNGEIITDYSGTVTLTTSSGHGDWANTDSGGDAYGALTPGASDSGVASYTFTADDQGSITLNLSNPRSESLTITAVESFVAAEGTSAGIYFSTNDFELTRLSHGNSIVGMPTVWQLDMLSVDSSTGSCSVNNTYASTGIKIWLERLSGDAGGALPTVVDDNSGATATVVEGKPSSNNFNLIFVDGSAQFTVNTTDVIRFKLYATDDSLAFTQAVLEAGAGDLNYTPFGYYVDVVGNPEASTVGGAKFQDAGKPFTVNVTAVAWQAADDSNMNALPDNHNVGGATTRADLSDNPVIASIGREDPPESITLTASLLLPAGGNNPGLQDGSSGNAHIITQFVNGTGSVDTLYFDEAGIIEIKAEVTDGEYFNKTAAKTAASQSYSANVGRFTPAKFTFNSGSLISACSSGLDFAYLDQGFTGEFSFSPQSRNNSMIQNYHSGFDKLVMSDFEFYAKDSNSGTLLTERLAANINSLAWSGGTGTVNASFNIARASAPDGPYTTVDVSTFFVDSDFANLKNTDKNADGDGDGSDESALIETTELRFGRLRLGDAHGPETYSLNVPLVVEYWQNPDWLINEDDSCTALPLTAINYPSGTASAQANRTVALGGGSTTGSYVGLAAGVVPFVAGELEHAFSAPGVGNVGSFNTSIDLTAFPWLQYDWNADGSYTDSQTPDNHINFGSYRGHDRMIFWQEY